MSRGQADSGEEGALSNAPGRRLVLSVIALALVAAGDAVAQDRRQAVSDARLDSIVRRVESMVPGSGAPGTTVTLRTGGLPHVTPLRIGVGAVRFGFEEVGQVLSSEKGEISLEVTVPSWARRDLTHRFIVFDFYFVPIALSEVFYVTDADGLLLREGTLVRAGPRCQALRSDDGLTYSLAGDVSRFKVGSRVVVEGRIARSSACTDGITIEIVRLTAAGR